MRRRLISQTSKLFTTEHIERTEFFLPQFFSVFSACTVPQVHV